MRQEIRRIKKNLYEHVNVLSRQIGERNSYKYDSLQRAHHYISTVMKKSSFQVKDLGFGYQKFIFTNIEAEKIGNTHPEEIIVIGAHYDTVIGTPGADDNASGVATLLEFIRLFDDYDNKRTLRLVAFTLEEPPFHGTPQMGSYVYAKRCSDRRERIIAMFSLEMLAYYSNKRKTQKYPNSEMARQYTDKGNFISIVSNEDSGAVGEKICREIKNHSAVPAVFLVAHPSIPGVNLSDHDSFWSFGYKALMITDTAFYRNPNYHKAGDTIDTLNFKYFSKMVGALYYAFRQLDLEGV